MILQDTTKINCINTIKSIMPHNNWFIAGGFAATNTYSDIDIFFLTENDYTIAETYFNNIITCGLISETFPFNLSQNCKTSNATTYTLSNKETCSTIDIQLVKKHFGTIPQILNTFDINLCQAAIKPNLEIVEDPTFKDLPTIHKINSNTFSRLRKYIKRSTPYTAQELYDAHIKMIDTYITDLSIMPSYYDDSNYVKARPINKALSIYIKCTLPHLNVVTNTTSPVLNTSKTVPFHQTPERAKILQYLNEQIILHAPELLL